MVLAVLNKGLSDGCRAKFLKTMEEPDKHNWLPWMTKEARMEPLHA
tara:strand:- start:373 stop:510 length:138 start_codon:yes stop_codon:yes gene_type:complete